MNPQMKNLIMYVRVASWYSPSVIPMLDQSQLQPLAVYIAAFPRMWHVTWGNKYHCCFLWNPANPSHIFKSNSILLWSITHDVLKEWERVKQNEDHYQYFICHSWKTAFIGQFIAIHSLISVLKALQGVSKIHWCFRVLSFVFGFLIKLKDVSKPCNRLWIWFTTVCFHSLLVLTPMISSE